MGILDDVTAYVNFLCKNKLSPNQFLLCYLLYTERLHRGSNRVLYYSTAGNIYKHCEEGVGWSDSEVGDLIEKEYVIDTTKNSSNYHIDRLILTEKFSDLMFIDANYAFEEIFELYPNSVKIDGDTAFLKGVDPDVVAERYKRIIKGSVVKHNEIKELIQYGKENDLIKNRIDRFIMGKLWEGIKQHRDEKGESYGKELY